MLSAGDVIDAQMHQKCVGDSRSQGGRLHRYGQILPIRPAVACAVVGGQVFPSGAEPVDAPALVDRMSAEGLEVGSR